MRVYALNYQQLIRQAIQEGFANAELSQLATAYDLGRRMTDGLYRKQNVPFICHLVRTGSIVMRETRDPISVVVGMLHAVFFLHVFQGSTRRGPRASDRELIRIRLGADVEELIHEYSQFSWNASVAAYWADSSRVPDETTRRILILRLCDELEDHLDGAEAFVSGGAFRAGDPSYGSEYIALTHALGLAKLADDFKEALEINQELNLPADIVSEHTSSFECRDRLMGANWIERVGSRLRRFRMKHAR